MNRALRAAVEAALGAQIVRVEPVSGGDINDAHAVTLSGGTTVFVKSNAAADPRLFPAEARGLGFLSASTALRVPRVLAVSGAGAPFFLVLEYLDSGPRVPDFDERLGRGLARLHQSGASGARDFGLDHDNFIGRLPQSNRPRASWAEFYREERLGAQLRAAVDAGLATPRMRRGLERLSARLEDLVGPPEPPAALHGDLWGGNLHVDGRGEPCLIDPAVYLGHREVDLAMMRLFGGFGERVFEAYAEAHALAAGHEGRIPLYQLYPLLVHVNLFGGSYVGAVERTLSLCV